MNKMKIGTIVQLNSGRHAMTSGLDDPVDKRNVICTWAVNGVIKEKSLHKNQLKIMEVDELKHLHDIIKGIKS